jgi:hypothetical protein
MALLRILLLLSLISSVTWRVATEDGRGIDPNGRPGISSSATCDEGNGLDPHGGRCTQSNAGVIIDPNG